MTDLSRWAVMFFIGSVVGALLILSAVSIRTRDGVWLSCDIVNQSLDLPLDVRTECRRRKRK